MKLLNLIADLEENRNELLAESMSKYMQDKFRFLGVRGATRTEIYKKYFPDARKTKTVDWDFVESCWNKEERISVCSCLLFKGNAEILKKRRYLKVKISNRDKIMVGYC